MTPATGRKSIGSKVQGQEKQAHIDKLLRVLLEDRDTAAFEMVLRALEKWRCDIDIYKIVISRTIT